MPGCSTRTTLQLVGPTSWTEVSAALRYDSGDPFAVRIRFGGRAEAVDGDDAGSGVEWLVARDLLHAGLSRPSGDGDIRLWPARTPGDVLFLELRAPPGTRCSSCPAPCWPGSWPTPSGWSPAVRSPRSSTSSPSSSRCCAANGPTRTAADR
ncbi:SsgA family sporulation/cell division regulator [Klenkia terrae]|uniref:SsgA family sporulation/cell division regulator n=1 Tax=Klenkia terrae TaxID=1052259 RepID=UPI00362289CA